MFLHMITLPAFALKYRIGAETTIIQKGSREAQINERCENGSFSAEMNQNKRGFMFTTVDNSDPFVRIQFHSNDEFARMVNRQAVLIGGTDRRVNHPEAMGGYRYPILEYIAAGSDFCIVTCPLPSTPAQNKAYERLRDDPDTLYGYVDASKIVFVQVANKPSGALINKGWNVTFNAGGKTAKRLKTLNRPFRWWTSFEDRPIHVHILADDAYSDLAEEGFTSEEIESLLDGAFIINSKLVDECRDNIRFLQRNETTDPTLSIDQLRQYYYMRESAEFVSFNARIFGPMSVGGCTEFIESFDGMIKGEAYKADFSQRRGYENVDVICAASALKHEVYNDDIAFVLMEPQVGKLSAGEIQVFSDMQTISNNPALFQPAQIKQFTAAWVDDMLDHLKRGNLLDSWYSQTNAAFHDGKFHSLDDVNTMVRWQARAWAMSGMSYTQSPWMFDHLASLMADSLRATDDRKMKFPVPAAMRVLVISSSMAQAFGWEDDIERGTIRFYGDMEALVVNDEDWIEMRPSHGGHDLDDFFVAYYRLIDGQRKVILVRSPNDWGEYTVFDYFEGDHYPYWLRANGERIEFPEISSDPSLWPQRLSEAIAANAITYVGLPSQHQPKPPKGETVPYNRSHIDAQVASAPNSANSVGGNVNARTLYALTIAPHEGHRPIQLCSMEQAIDAGTQSVVKEDVTAVLEEAASVIKSVQESNYKVDLYMWNTRFATRYGLLPKYRIDEKGRLTLLNQLRGDKAKAFRVLATNWSKENCRPPAIVHTLGLSRARQALEILTRVRINMVLMQPENEQSLQVEHWQMVNKPVIDLIESFEHDHQRHDFVIALWSAAINRPTTSSGRITDQIVMNPQVFPHLLDALRYYGLARYIKLDEHGHLYTEQIGEWELVCDGCGLSHTTTDPVVRQRYNLRQRLCTGCYSPVSASA